MPDPVKSVVTSSPLTSKPLTMAAAVPMSKDLCLYLPKTKAETRNIVVGSDTVEMPGNQDTIGLEGKFPLVVVIDGTTYELTKDDIVDVVYNDTPRPCVTYL